MSKFKVGQVIQNICEQDIIKISSIGPIYYSIILLEDPRDIWHSQANKKHKIKIVEVDDPDEEWELSPIYNSPLGKAIYNV